jgi:CubicO group peptidase (beta-lactamase class C family)
MPTTPSRPSTSRRVCRPELASLVLSVVIALIPLVPAALAADPEPAYTADVAGRYSAEEDAVYHQRLELRSSTRRDFDTYEPTEPVIGTRAWHPLPTATPAERTLSAAALDAARRYAADHASSSLLVWRLGRLELEAYFGDQKSDQPVIARSLGKPLAVMAVGRALALGKIQSLDQPVADFFPTWRDGTRRSRMHIRHLLDMTSGFPPQGFSARADDLMNLAYEHPHHDEIIERDMPVIAEPGTTFAYNNAQFELIARLLERATGDRYADFLGRELLAPIGARGGEVWVNRPGGTAHSACCLMMPAESWLRLGILLAQDGVWRGQRLLPQGFVQRMVTGTAANTHYGLGVYVAGDYLERRGWAGPNAPPSQSVLHSEPYLARDLFVFDGNGNQVLYVIPSEELVILRTGTSPPRATEWDNSYLPNTLLRGIVRERGTSVPQPGPAARR